MKKGVLDWIHRKFSLLLWLYQSKDIPVIVVIVLASSMMYNWSTLRNVQSVRHLFCRTAPVQPAVRTKAEKLSK